MVASSNVSKGVDYSTFLDRKENGIATLENSSAFSTKLIIQLKYNPTSIVLDICPREMKIQAHTNTCTWCL